jgi:hypothetical protein
MKMETMSSTQKCKVKKAPGITTLRDEFGQLYPDGEFITDYTTFVRRQIRTRDLILVQLGGAL